MKQKTLIRLYVLLFATLSRHHSFLKCENSGSSRETSPPCRPFLEVILREATLKHQIYGGSKLYLRSIFKLCRKKNHDALIEVQSLKMEVTELVLGYRKIKLRLKGVSERLECLRSSLICKKKKNDNIH